MGGWCVGYVWQWTGQSGIYMIVMVWEACLYKHRFGIYPDLLCGERRCVRVAIYLLRSDLILTQRDSFRKN